MQDAARQQELLVKKLLDSNRSGKKIEEIYGYE